MNVYIHTHTYIVAFLSTWQLIRLLSSLRTCRPVTRSSLRINSWGGDTWRSESGRLTTRRPRSRQRCDNHAGSVRRRVHVRGRSETGAQHGSAVRTGTKQIYMKWERGERPGSRLQMTTSTSSQVKHDTTRKAQRKTWPVYPTNYYLGVNTEEVI